MLCYRMSYRVLYNRKIYANQSGIMKEGATTQKIYTTRKYGIQRKSKKHRIYGAPPLFFLLALCLAFFACFLAAAESGCEGL